MIKTTDRVLGLVLLLFLSIGLMSCGSGGGSSSSSAVAASATNIPRFAYVANYNSNTVSIYTVDNSTGRLRHNGYAVTGTNPRSVAVAPSGKFAYVANNGSDDVSAYTINQTTGALTSVGANVAAGTTPRSVTVSGSIQ